MTITTIAILTTESSWFLPYAKELTESLYQNYYHVKLFYNHEDIPDTYDIIFILSYFRIIPQEYLDKHYHNLVVHESDLPQGKGWSPLFWQVLEGKNRIPIVLFEAGGLVDSGDIYFKDYIELEGHELNQEIRHKQAIKTIELCKRFLGEYKNLKPVKQKGKETIYPKRTFLDSELDIDKSIKEQFDLLRTCDNENYPGYFYHRGHKYILKIEKGVDSNENSQS